MLRLIQLAWEGVRDWCAEAGRGWSQFWFRAVDPTSLGLLRILAGGMLLYSTFVWGLDFETLLGPEGMYPPQVVHSLEEGSLAWSFWWYVPWDWAWNVHLLCLGILFLFTIGYRTAVTKILAFVISVSYLYRAPMSNYGMDQFSSNLIFYLMLSPCGQALSVDWYRARYRAALAQFQAGAMAPALPERGSIGANLILRLIQVQLCLVYFFAGISKLRGESWWDGMAMWQGFANYEYQSWDMTWLAFHPDLIALTTHVTIFWELTFAALVWPRMTRGIVLFIGIVMHLGIGALMGMWTFGLLMIFGYLAFWPGDHLRQVLAGLQMWVTGQPPVVIDPADPASLRSAARQRALDLSEAREFINLADQTPEAGGLPGEEFQPDREERELPLPVGTEAGRQLVTTSPESETC